MYAVDNGLSQARRLFSHSWHVKRAELCTLFVAVFFSIHGRCVFGVVQSEGLACIVVALEEVWWAALTQHLWDFGGWSPNGLEHRNIALCRFKRTAWYDLVQFPTQVYLFSV